MELLSTVISAGLAYAVSYLLHAVRDPNELALLNAHRSVRDKRLSTEAVTQFLKDHASRNGPPQS